MRWLLNGTYRSFADICSFILDTTTVKTRKPTITSRDFEEYAFQFWNQHKKTFGVKLEVAVAMQRTPVPIAVSVIPGGWSDIRVARLPGGILSRLRPGERALGDPGYQGDGRIYAPPRANMLSYVEELDKAELTLQRRVELANAHLKQFKVLGTTFRKGVVHAFRDLEVIGIVVAKLVTLDTFISQDHSGFVHTSGPLPDPVPVQRPAPRGPMAPSVRRALMRLNSNKRKNSRRKK